MAFIGLWAEFIWRFTHLPVSLRAVRCHDNSQGDHRTHGIAAQRGAATGAHGLFQDRSWRVWRRG